MHSPFYNPEISVRRASLVLTIQIILFVVTAQTALVVGWRSGELQTKVLKPSQILAKYAYDQLIATINEEKDVPLVENTNWQKSVNINVNGNATTSVTTSINGKTKTITTQKYTVTPNPVITNQQPNSNAQDYSNFSNSNYTPPAWFVEESNQAKENFEELSQQRNAEFESYTNQSKIDFEKSKAESQTKFDAIKKEMGF